MQKRPTHLPIAAPEAFLLVLAIISDRHLSLAIKMKQETPLPPKLAARRAAWEARMQDMHHRKRSGRLPGRLPDMGGARGMRLLLLALLVGGVAFYYYVGRQQGTTPTLQPKPTLNLSYGAYTPLPASLNGSPVVTKLLLNHNTLEALPPEVCQLPALRYLDASANRLTELPPCLAQLAELQVLHLAHNQLTELPPDMAKLTKLQNLNLSYNNLRNLPPWLANLPQLQQLNLQGNVLPAEEVAALQKALPNTRLQTD